MSAGIDGGGDAVEEPPPELERARDGPPHGGLERRGGRQADDDVVADGAVLAVRLLVHVPEGDLGGRAPVVPREGARERAEGGAREPSLRDPEPERMAAEGAAGVDHRPQIVDEGAAVRHRPDVYSET